MNRFINKVFQGIAVEYDDEDKDSPVQGYYVFVDRHF